MPNAIFKTQSDSRIIGSAVLIATLFLCAVAALIIVSEQQLRRGLQAINRAELTELARQIALTMDASLDPTALTNPKRMQQIVDQNIASRKTNNADNLLVEIRIHAPDHTSSVGYRAIAGSAPQLIGQESDPEDIAAVKHGKIVVLNEVRDGVPILDITCPLHRDGVAFATAGIKMSMQQGFALIDLISAGIIRSLRFAAAVAAILGTLIGVTTLTSLLRSNAVRRRLVISLHEQASTDELTGLINRRKFTEIAASEMKRATRFEHPLAIALLDIDRFKQINDEYGHSIGDKALVAVATILQTTIRETDIAARLGGDEISMILPETSATEAYEVLERCRQNIGAGAIDLGGAKLPISVSIGVTAQQNAEETLEALMERADRALYKAKKAGRNKVLIE